MTTYITGVVKLPPTDIPTLSVGIVAAVCTYATYRYLRGRGTPSKRKFVLLGLPALAYLLCLSVFAQKAYYVHGLLYSDISLKITNMEAMPIRSPYFPHPVGLSISVEIEGDFPKNIFFTDGGTLMIKDARPVKERWNYHLNFEQRVNAQDPNIIAKYASNFTRNKVTEMDLAELEFPPERARFYPDRSGHVYMSWNFYSIYQPYSKYVRILPGKRIRSRQICFSQRGAKKALAKIQGAGPGDFYAHRWTVTLHYENNRREIGLAGQMNELLSENEEAQRFLAGLHDHVEQFTVDPFPFDLLPRGEHNVCIKSNYCLLKDE